MARRFGIGFFCVVLVCGCGGTDPTAEVAETSTTASTTTALDAVDGDEPLAQSLLLGLEDCDRFSLTTRVDAEAARAYVPEDMDVFEVGGQAVFSFHALNCADLQTDGTCHGPGRFGTVWIRVVDPATVPPIPSGSGMDARPNDAFHVVLFNTDNELFYASTLAFGVPMTHAEVIALDPPAEGMQSGSMIDSAFAPAIDLHWTVDNQSRGTVGGQVGKHLLIGSDLTGESLTYYGEFEHAPGWHGNVATIEVAPGSAFDDLIGPSTTSPANGDPVSVQMVVFR